MLVEQTRSVPLFRPFLPPEQILMPRLRDVLYSGQISEGPPVQEFEERFAAAFALPNAASFYSGTAALHVALIVAGVRPGDEVISTPMTAEPTNMAIMHAGGRVVWADVDPANGNLAPSSIAEKMTPRTRAIVVVHYGGVPASLNAIRTLALAAGVPVIEDAAHALGARYAGLPIGCHSEYTMFSLQAIKHMTTVDGGMLTLADAEQLRDVRLIRWFGIDRHASRTEVDVPVIGYKYHMNNVTATIGLVQLEYIHPVLDAHRANGRHFDDALRNVPGLELCRWDAEAEPSYWFYTVLADDRDGLARKLTERGIGNSLAHRRNDEHSVFSESRTALPGLDRFYARMLHIPCGWWVTPEHRERIAEVIREGW
jgi:perosamine synthetase